MDNSSNPWKGSIVPPWRGDGGRAKTRAREASCPSSHRTGTRLRVLLKVLWPIPTGFLDHADRGHPDQGFVFDDEDHLSCRCFCHDQSPSCVAIL
jgi:hypothetical protein